MRHHVNPRTLKQRHLAPAKSDMSAGACCRTLWWFGLAPTDLFAVGPLSNQQPRSLYCYGDIAVWLAVRPPLEACYAQVVNAFRTKAGICEAV